VADFQDRPATVESAVAQGDSDSIGCRSAVNGVFNAETISHEVDAFTACLLKAA
jgi:Mycobacterium membrane protein